MFKYKTPEGFNNICGGKILEFRERSGLSQNGLAKQLQLLGMDAHKNTIQRFESRQGFVTDIELFYLARYFHCHVEELMDFDEITAEPVHIQ